MSSAKPTQISFEVSIRSACGAAILSTVVEIFKPNAAIEPQAALRSRSERGSRVALVECSQIFRRVAETICGQRGLAIHTTPLITQYLLN